MKDIILPDFPDEMEIDWREFANRVGIDNAMWFLDNYGGGDRKHIVAGSTIRGNRRKRLQQKSSETTKTAV